MTEEYKNQYAGKSISELNFIIHNDHKHTQEQVIAAKQVIETKRMEWRAENITTAKRIDALIREQGWFDFHVLSYDGHKLVIGGNYDLTYYHCLEIIFEDVFFVSGFFRGWRSNTDNVVFQIPGNEKELNSKYEIEQDYQLFVFRTENYENDVVIAANKVSFNTDTVYYYDRPDLKPNERIAGFVKKKTS